MRRALLALLAPSLAFAEPTWQADWSKTALSPKAAAAYCAKRGKGWRLPTKEELLTVGGKLPDEGYLWSGDDVSRSRAGQKWIMNLANQHIFNGDGRTGFAKCVKGPPPPKQVPPPFGEPHAIVGKPDAKLTVLVALQPDYPWWKIRPTLDELAAKHSVKFDLRVYLVWDKYMHAGAGYCAAAKLGKLPDYEAKLKAVSPKSSLDAKAVLDLGVAAGIDAKDFERESLSCLGQMTTDHERFKAKDFDSVPTFWVGEAKIAGAFPDKLTAAVEAALKP